MNRIKNTLSGCKIKLKDKTSTYFLIFLPVVLFLLPNKGICQIAKVTVTPEFFISQTYDDNINLDNTLQKSDNITTISARIYAEMKAQYDQFNISYSPSAVAYQSYSENNTVRHNANIQYTHFFTKHLTLDFEDRYLKTENNIEHDRGSQSVRTSRNKYQRNNAAASVRYSFAKKQFMSAGYSFQTLENEDSTVSDLQQDSIFASASLSFFTKSDLFLRAQTDRNIADPTSNGSTGSESRNYSETVRYTYNYSQLSKYYLNYRHDHRKFETTNSKSAVHNFTAGTDHDFNSSTSGVLEGGYYFRETNGINSSDGMLFKAGLNKNAKKWSVGATATTGWDEDFLEAGVRGYTQYQSLSGNYDYRIGKNVYFSANTTYRQNENSAGSKGATFSAQTSLDWNFMEYYRLNLGYAHYKHTDDLASAEYIDNRIFLTFYASKEFKDAF